MSRQNEQLWATLVQAGLTEGAMPGTGKLESPWYVKVLLAFSGWLAALFLLGFIGMGFEFVLKNGGIAAIVGGILIGGAFALLRIPGNEFIDHLALAVSLAGQALVVFAVFDIADRNEKIAWLLVALLQMLLAVAMPHFVHRVFSSCVAALALSMTLTFRGWPEIISGLFMVLAAWCWLNEFRFPRQMRTIRAIGFGQVLALIQLKGTAAFGYQTMGWQFTGSQPEVWARPWIGEVIPGLVALYVVWRLLHRSGRAISERISLAALLGTFLLCAVSLQVHGLTAGMVILLLGFAGSHRVLLGLGMVSLLCSTSAYYYLLDATLLAKSLNLLIVGLVLLLLRWILRWKLRWLMPAILPENKGDNHA